MKWRDLRPGAGWRTDKARAHVNRLENVAVEIITEVDMVVPIFASPCGQWNAIATVTLLSKINFGMRS